MSIERVKEYFRAMDLEQRVWEFETSSATVELAAETLGVRPARIAKTLSFEADGGCILIVAAGDARIDNRKFKDQFEKKAKMLSPEDVLRCTGSEIGGVCPFALPEGSEVYVVVPASVPYSAAKRKANAWLLNECNIAADMVQAECQNAAPRYQNGLLKERTLGYVVSQMVLRIVMLIMGG